MEVLDFTSIDFQNFRFLRILPWEQFHFHIRLGDNYQFPGRLAVFNDRGVISRVQCPKTASLAHVSTQPTIITQTCYVKSYPQPTYANIRLLNELSNKKNYGKKVAAIDCTSYNYHKSSKNCIDHTQKRCNIGLQSSTTWRKREKQREIVAIMTYQNNIFNKTCQTHVYYMNYFTFVSYRFAKCTVIGNKSKENQRGGRRKRREKQMTLQY